jgi:TnpA family transposase
MLRLSGSLLQGRVPATGIMRTLQVGDNPTRLAQAIAEFGRIDKTLHSLRLIKVSLLAFEKHRYGHEEEHSHAEVKSRVNRLP